MMGGDKEGALEAVLRRARELGIDAYAQGSVTIDERYAYKLLSKALEREGVIYTSIKEAFKEYGDIVYRYGLKSVKIDERGVDGGVFLYVPRGVKLSEPIYTCFALFRSGVVQRVYNLTVIEQGAAAVGATGCMSLVPEGAHVSLEEVYVGEGSSLVSIMIHNWMARNLVSAYKHVSLSEGSTYYDIYVNNSPIKNIKFNTVIEQPGSRSSSRVEQIVVGRSDGEYLYDTRVYLRGEGSSSELISRGIAADMSKLSLNLTLEAEGRGSRGHIECKGLMLGETASLSSSPVLRALEPTSTLTHEASIGKIRREEIEYLMSKGFTEEESIAIIVRGFMETGFERVPDKIKRTFSTVLDQITRATM